MTSVEKDLLTLPFAASAMGISVQTARKMVRQGRLSLVSVSERRSFVKREKVERILSGQTIKAPKVTARA